MKLINSNRFFLNVPAEPENWLHLAEVQDGVHTYICFADKITATIYIEEVIGSHFELIEDDNKVADIAEFLRERKILDMTHPLLSDKQWFKL